VSRKKNKWEAKVMVQRKWAYRELFSTEEEAGEDYTILNSGGLVHMYEINEMDRLRMKSQNA
jgi:hypothetical protein